VRPDIRTVQEGVPAEVVQLQLGHRPVGLTML